MKALDPISFEQQMVDYIDKLIEVDNYRQNYYKDLSKQDRVNDHSIFNRMKIADIKQFAVAFFEYKKQFILLSVPLLIFYFSVVLWNS